MHVHFKQEELVRVITGKMRVKTLNKEFSLNEGQEYVFAPGEAHKIIPRPGARLRRWMCA